VATSPAAGIRHVAICVVVMLAAHRLFSTGVHDRVLTHGQSCFVVGASVCTGVYFAFRFAPVRSSLWPVLSVFAYSLLCYVLAAVTSGAGGGAPGLPATIPASHFLVALPIQTLGVGCATAVGSFWWRHAVEAMMQAHADLDRQPQVSA